MTTEPAPPTQLVPTVEELVTDLILREVAAFGSLASFPGARDLARSILDLLGGPDDELGPLDRYKLFTVPVGDRSVIAWRCPGPHEDAGGYVGVVARDLDMGQSGLTVGEVLEAVLAHDREHGDGARAILAATEGDDHA